MPKIALIEYFTTKEKVYIFVVRPEDDKPIVLEAKITETQLKDCRDKLLGNKKRNIKGSFRMANFKGPGAYIDYFYELSGELIHKFLPYVEGYDTLVLVPHGWLHYLPLHALKCEDGKYLIEKFKIVYSPSATVIKYCQDKNKARQNKNGANRDRNCLAFGVGIKSNKPIEHQLFHNEARYVAEEIFGARGECKIGVEASKKYFIENCNHKDVIHAACHGHFDELQPLESGLLFSNGTRLPIVNRKDSTIIEVPEDMLLTAEDIFNLELHADLVVLSACVTGVNENKPGDELIGLTRALIYAGTPSVIVSLWSVYSESTLELMKSFYKYWADPKQSFSKAEALQKAQLDMIHKSPDILWEHPFFWAPFILVGDWM